MIIYILYLQKQLSDYHPEKMIGMDLMCPIIKKKELEGK